MESRPPETARAGKRMRRFDLERGGVVQRSTADITWEALTASTGWHREKAQAWETRQVGPAQAGPTCRAEPMDVLHAKVWTD